MSKPTVSIIILAYNQVNTIRETLDSIILQKCNFQIEIIIGDDCSLDGTREICLEYKKRHTNIININLLFHNTNKGVATNFVICVNQAMGKYIALCGGDDYWHNPDKLRLQIDFLENNDEYGIVHTDYDQLDVTRNIIISCKNQKDGKKYLKDI